MGLCLTCVGGYICIIFMNSLLVDLGVEKNPLFIMGFYKLILSHKEFI